MDFTLQEKAKLIEFFEFLLNKEIDKPLGEMNSEAVDNYIKILLHLQDKHVELNSEFIDKQVRKIFREEENTVAPEAVKTTKKYFNKKKVWLVAACIAILVALFSIVSFSSEKGVVDTLEDFFGTFEFIPFGNEVDVGNETYSKDGKNKEYNSINKFIENEKIPLLFPNNMANNINLITILNIDSKDEIHIVFDTSDLFITITRNCELPQEIIDICNDTITLNGIDYYLCIMDDVNQAQAYFIHNNNMYVITHTNESELMEILNNMEEITYEN